MNERRPGQWPVDDPADLGTPPSEDELYTKRQQEKALREMCLNSIQHDLEQQPTASSAHAKARVWCAQILAIAEDVAAEKRKAA